MSWDLDCNGAFKATRRATQWVTSAIAAMYSGGGTLPRPTLPSRRVFSQRDGTRSALSALIGQAPRALHSPKWQCVAPPKLQYGVCAVIQSK